MDEREPVFGIIPLPMHLVGYSLDVLMQAIQREVDQMKESMKRLGADAPLLVTDIRRAAGYDAIEIRLESSRPLAATPAESWPPSGKSSP